MVCPFCGEEMILGHIQPIGAKSTFWLPHNARLKALEPLTVKSIERVGGRVIGTATPFGLLSATLSDTLLCPKCNVLITKL